MKARKVLSLLWAAVAASAGCTAAAGPKAGDVRLAVRNSGAVGFDSLLVILPRGDSILAGRLEAGGMTPPAVTQEAYRYAYVRIWVGDQRYVLQPIDYVGESRLPAGCHVYEIELRTQDGVALRLDPGGCE